MSCNFLFSIFYFFRIQTKGTDSRLGVGFRLGEHADFQILFELGPQTDTDPIGTNESKKRRDVKKTKAL